MKYLKTLFSFLLPLFIVLTTFTLYSTISNIVKDYKKNIINDYAIMIVTSTPMIKDNLNSIGSINITNIQTLKREDIIKNMESKLSNASLKLLEQKLPFFYKIYLDDYPTLSQLSTIKQDLKKIPNIKRIETFSSDHSKIYSLLVLTESVVSIIFIFIMIFAVLIFSKQITIWFFEHSKRISIIQYHGGSTMYSALPMVKLALLSSILASTLTIALSIAVKNNLPLLLSVEVLSVIPNINSITINYFQIILMSFIISTISVIGVLMKHKIK